MNEEILNKKIKMEMRMSSQLLQESQELFSLYDLLFKEDFSIEINFVAHKTAQITEEEKMENPLDFINEEAEKEEEKLQRDPELYKIYKKIVMKTHPDRVQSESLVDLFDEATQAMGKNDWMTMLNIALDLKIKTPEFTEELRQKLQENILEMNKKIKKLQNTTAWVWANATEKDKEQIRLQVRQLMGIDEKSFQEHLKSTQE